MDFPEIGTLEAFNSDGLRSLLDDDEGPQHDREDAALPGSRRAHPGPARQRLLRHRARSRSGAARSGRSTSPRPSSSSTGTSTRRTTSSRSCGSSSRARPAAGRSASRTTSSTGGTGPTGFSSMARTTGFPGDGRGPPRPDRPVQPQRHLAAGAPRRRRGRVPGRHGPISPPGTSFIRREDRTDSISTRRRPR